MSISDYGKSVRLRLREITADLAVEVDLLPEPPLTPDPEIKKLIKNARKRLVELNDRLAGLEQELLTSRFPHTPLDRSAPGLGDGPHD